MTASRRALLGATVLGLALPARSQPRPRLALALGGGSARGFAHIGVARALEQAGIAADLVVGTSAGALVGAFLAAGWSAAQMEAFALQVREADVADFASAGRRGMLAGEALARIVAERLRGAQIEQLRTPFAAVTTDLRSGELVLLRQGPVADAVRASCSIPGVFVPPMVQGRELVDGGLVSPLPVRAARQLGAELVLAVDVAARPRRHDLSGLYEVVLQSFEIMGRALADQEALQADLVVRPDTAQFASSDFGARREMIQAGYEAALPLIPALRKRLDALAARPRRG
ncbi:patatin-like phospholipase family protein [Ideonella sp. 4Y16]|uniref:patatin-like phospholipase family protein n=1 Tax=Ideonella alba TaxID=2824118 RepID=UPI001B388866|nr:patatin-like phospholipase family protein [Ideonella alba]MBQ0945170.1 patatin-like phospholipase family protein [Ideonella alba]